MNWTGLTLTLLHFIIKVRADSTCSKLRSFVCRHQLFFYGVVCQSSSISAADKKTLDKLIKRASFMLRFLLGTMQVLGERRMITTLSSLLVKESHPLQDTTTVGTSFSEKKITSSMCRRVWTCSVKHCKWSNWRELTINAVYLPLKLKVKRIRKITPSRLRFTDHPTFF